MEKISNSIIVHGPGRSGTTLLANILSIHDELCWVSNYVNKYPNHLYLSALNRMVLNSSFEKWSRHKKQFPRPSEAYNFWLHYIPEFNKNTLDSISNTSAINGIKAIQSIQNFSRKKRFITKVTGFSRHQTITALFENPKILWIDRNPLSVISSFYKQKWNYKNKIELFENTPKEELLKFYTYKYISFQNDRDKLSHLPMKIVNYEDLVADPISLFIDICGFLDLPFTDKFKNIVIDWDINTTANMGFKKYLSSSDEVLIQSILKAN